MGWFWADTSPSAPVAPHPMPRGNAEPPPGCPMHKKASTTASRLPESASTPQGACPYVPPDTPTPASTATQTAPPPPKQGLLAKLNPLNNMPFDLSNRRSETQTQALPLDRETSTIPKGDGSLWEYPSPQQMYNAMLRKGYSDTDTSAVESMVAVHNFLNEGAWAEIVGWEKRFARGLPHGYDVCRRGEENANVALAGEGSGDWGMDTSWKDADVAPPKLLRFTGRPGEMTPKSRILQAVGWVSPRYATPVPFDRHDWFVQRCDGRGCREVRYVIDYYEGDPEPTGEPVFYLDVRPAVDGPRAAAERLVRWGTDVWWRASGGTVRELRKLEEERKEREEKMKKMRGQL